MSSPAFPFRINEVLPGKGLSWALAPPTTTKARQQIELTARSALRSTGAHLSSSGRSGHKRAGLLVVISSLFTRNASHQRSEPIDPREKTGRPAVVTLAIESAA